MCLRIWKSKVGTFILEGCPLMSLFLCCGFFDLVTDLVAMGLSLAELDGVDAGSVSQLCKYFLSSLSDSLVSCT